MTQPTEPIEYGFVCAACGLSEHGFARFLKLRFDPHPCGKCAHRFPPVLGPPAPVDEGSSSLRLVPPEASSDTPDTAGAGTLW